MVERDASSRNQGAPELSLSLIRYIPILSTCTSSSYLEALLKPHVRSVEHGQKRHSRNRQRADLCVVGERGGGRVTSE